MRKGLSDKARRRGDKATADKLAAKPHQLRMAKGKPREWTEEHELQTIEMKQSGMSSNDVAAVFGFSRQFVILKIAELRKRYGDDVIGVVDRSAITRDYVPIDGHDYNALYPDVPWQCRISGRCQVAGIPR